MNGAAHVVDALSGWVLGASFRTLLLALLVGGIDRLLPDRVSHRIRMWMWRLVLVPLCVPPQMTSPISAWPRVDAMIPPTGSADDSPSAGPASQGAEAQALPAWACSPAGRRAWAGIWLTGVLVCAGCVVRRRRMTRREWIEAPSRPVPPRVAQLAHEAADRIGLRYVPELRLHAWATGAAVVGLLRPVVVLPDGWVRTARREQWLHVLMHEFAHVRRRDPWTDAAGVLLQILYWFHPALWIARARWRTLREMACDEAVATALRDSAAEYRRTLLELSEAFLVRNVPLTFGRRRAEIVQRVAALRRAPASHGRIGRAVCHAGFLVLAACCVPGASSDAPRDTTRALEAEAPPGCLQLRYTVLQALAQERQALAH